ncbi:MAG: hypothetical protein U0228_10305 [Myxococcaceae bacterium]
MLRFIGGTAPRPAGQPLSPTDVPDDFLLRKLGATERERLLVGLALSLADERALPQPAPDRIAALLDALRRVAGETNAVSLEQVLELAARHRSLGFLVDAVDLEWLLRTGREKGVFVSDLLATTDCVSRRGLTRFEARRIHENFAGTLDPDTVRLCFTTGVQTMGAGAMVVGNTIHIDPTDPRWNVKPGTTLPAEPDDESWDSYNGVLLGHEPCHVWSYQHQGSRYAVNSVVDQLRSMQTGDRGGAYLYRPDRPHFLDYGEEQRAMLVQDFLAAQRAKQAGVRTTITMYGGQVDTEDALRTLTRYVDQMRAMGPGIAEPLDREPQWIVCACVQPFAQDGVAGFLGAQGSVLLAAAGRASTQAVVHGVATRNAGEVAAGLAGVAGGVAASLLPREQNASGAASGGSAILDQAGIPHGVEVGRDGLTGGVKVDWDAPGQGSAPGMKDPRVQWSGSAKGDVGQAQVEANARATVAFAGDVRQVSGDVKVSGDDGSLEVGAGFKPQHGKDPSKAWGHLELVTDPVSVRVGGQVTSRDGKPLAASVDSRVEAGAVSFTTDTSFARTQSDAPLALDSSTLGLEAQVAPGVSTGVEATLVPGGVDAVAAQVSAVGDAGTLTARAEATKLTTTPTVGASVTATSKQSGVSVGAHGEVTPATGAVEGGVTVSLPLDPPRRK